MSGKRNMDRYGPKTRIYRKENEKTLAEPIDLGVLYAQYNQPRKPPSIYDENMIQEFYKGYDSV